MNLLLIRRAVLCAALIALSVAGAGWFSTPPVAGQETTLHGAAALEKLKQDGQYESLQAAVNQARFSVSRVEATPLGRWAWHAPNAAAGYDAYVTEAGVSIAINHETYVSLSLHALGYGEALHAVGPGEVFGDKQSINIIRNGGLREWFVNGPDGLEHGFTLSEPPPGARQQGVPLRLALAVSEGWQAIASEDGKLVTLRNGNDQAVDYGKLAVHDKLGMNLPARLTVVDEQVVIEVEDHDAQYPLTIDPLFTLQHTLFAPEGAASDYFGIAVALDGDTALVGAYGDDSFRGAAYVFLRNGPLWTFQQKLVAPDGAAFDEFGFAVALDGDTALIGASNGPNGTNLDQGAAYVFVRNGSSWTFQQRLNANSALREMDFGSAVALDGDTALIGAQSFSTNANFIPGTAYVFVRGGTAWTRQAQLFPSDIGNFNRCGAAVALDGDTALVGSPGASTELVGRGSAAVFTRTGTTTTTTWKEQIILTTSDTGPNDNFGSAVALNGETAAIGAPLYGGDDRGKVFTFKRNATSWMETDRTEAPNPAAGARFGAAVAVSGDRLVVGATLALFAQSADQRTAYLFVRNGSWRPVKQFGPGLGSINDRLGYAVALDGDTLLVGVPRGDAAFVDQGAVAVFVLHDSRHVEQQKLFARDGAKDDYFGAAVALDGDTLAIGAPYDNVGTTVDQGSVYIFVREGAAQPVWKFQQQVTANDGADSDFFGRAVALSGDRLAVGADEDDVGTIANRGSVYLFKRSGTTWTQETRLDSSGLADQHFGSAVALEGNTLVVGAPYASQGRGIAYAFLYVANTTWIKDTLTPSDNSPGDGYGTSVALNGNTAVIGAPYDDNDTTLDQGSAYVFARANATTTAWGQQKKLLANDGAAKDFFGYAVAVSGDTAAIGAYGDTLGPNVAQGSAYVFKGSGAVWTQQQKLTANDGGASDSFGIAVALNDTMLVIGAHADDIGTASAQGSAYAFTNLGGNWYQQPKLTASDGARLDYFGGAVAVSGDTVLVGAFGDDFDASTAQGSAYVFVSPRCGALTVAPASLPHGALDLTYNQSLAASGGSGAADYSFAVSSGALPPGLTLDALGLLSGKPTAVGTYRFSVTATFLLSLCTGSREYTLTIQACPTITIRPATLPNGAVGTAYRQEVSATGGTGQHGFAITAGALPPGLSFNFAGTLSGTPTQAGSYNFTVTATSNNCTSTQAYTLTISHGVVTCVSAASYLPGAAPESIVAAFGVQMAQQTQAAASVPLPTTLAGVSVRIRDSQNVERLAPLFFVSPGQINLQIPTGTATGTATVTLSTGATGQVEIKTTAPGLFAANADGQGVPAAVALRVKANGAQSYEAIAQFNGTRFMPAPLDLGPAGEQVFLVLYGTGFRFQQQVSVRFGGEPGNVLFAGAVAGLVGLDQANVLMPRSLIGVGELFLTFSVDGVNANPVRIHVR